MEDLQIKNRRNGVNQIAAFKIMLVAYIYIMYLFPQSQMNKKAISLGIFNIYWSKGIATVIMAEQACVYQAFQDFMFLYAIMRQMETYIKNYIIHW